MAIFRVPRITTTQRSILLLEEGEIVFDTDLKKFFGGDGITLGGKELCYCGGETVDGVITTESGDSLLTEDGSYIEFEFAIFTTESGDIITTELNEILEV
jgi:hypothetical protein